MYSCPSCRQKGISFWSKQFYTAWTLPTCQFCGEKSKISISWTLLILFLLPVPAMIVFIAVAAFIGDVASPLVGLITSFLALFVLASMAFHLIPLRPKSRQS